MCPCSKGLECPICDHYPSKLSESPVKLADLMKPELLKRERSAFESSRQK
jgi:hypothetical protein